ncbi:double-strand break repair protein AddB [Oricola sp.]|uniref:double-strand break repair protein AddB n=1 Tax=Oricola sp. TaxID=1979950 RepID=UPI003BA864E0
MAKFVQPRVYTVPPGAAFLPAVAGALCDGHLVPGFSYGGDPLRLSSALIYVPTRRAARELRSAFLDHLGGESILLPHIRPLGEFDEDAGRFDGDGAAAADIPPAIDRTERLLLLGRLVASWTKHLKIDTGRLYGDEVIQTPVSRVDAFWLARDLASLMDQFSTGGVDASQIASLDTSELSEWWKVTLAFLEIMRREWPDILAERGVLDPGDHRNRRILAEAERLKRNPPSGPVVVAGSTGTIPATAELIRTIARLPTGAVVLPGFDTGMDEPSRDALASDTDVASVIGHPQYGLYRLAAAIGIAHDAVEPLGEPISHALQQRQLWVAESLRPASVTDRWMQTRPRVSDAAFEKVELLEAPNEHMEAAAIAAALREAIHDPDAMAALVTPDRDLARRVVAELARYGISATDTGGTPLAATVPGRLLCLVLETVFNPGDPSTLLALLKHPLVKISATPDAHGRAVDLFEIAILRGGAGRIDTENLADFAAQRLVSEAQRGSRRAVWLGRMTETDIGLVTGFAERTSAALSPLAALAARDDEIPFLSLITATVMSLEALCRDADGRHDTLYNGEDGSAVQAFLGNLLAADTGFSMPAREWPQAVAALMADAAVKPAPGGHPRISIWGTLEARLQTVDLMVLGGLNEGGWPQQTANDQFLTRSMKAGLGIEPPERRIGLSAHDFQMAMGQRRVILSRSERSDGAPSIASRWLQRLATFAGGETVARLVSAGNRYVDLARAVESTEKARYAPRPRPAPPLDARPKSISVTEVETLIRDPYAVYARRVLGLEPFDDLVRDPAAAERGMLFHAIFEEAVREGVDPLGPQAAAQMTDIARRLFTAEELPVEIRTVWWPRIETGVAGIADWEAGRASRVNRRFPEIAAAPTVVDGTDVSLRGRADRLDVMQDGSVEIIDFKTGFQPSAKMVRTLLSPQMPLEGALLRRGAFSEVGSKDIAGMLYLKVDGRGQVKESDVLKGSRTTGDVDPAALSEKAWNELSEMLRWYADPANGYLSRRMLHKISQQPGDYDHLARVHEWLIGDGDGDE